MAGRSAGWILKAPGDIDRIEACFAGAAFAPHRHDTYAVGVTLSGVQSFDYRGATRRSLPGQLVILHPDETHDGRAGDDNAFRYRTAYIAPSLIQNMLGGRPLPFVPGGVSSDPRLCSAVWALLEDIDRPLMALEGQDALLQVANALQLISGGTGAMKAPNRQAATRARDYIETRVMESISLDDLERAAHHDRWQLSRDFRALFGTSPYRYLMLRRLDEARRMMLAGQAAAGVAVACGFCDQSHFNRVFKSAFGLTPRAWLRAVAGAHDRSISTARSRAN